MTDIYGGRKTSENIVVEWLPCGVEQTHDEDFQFNANVTGGTFKLRVNGELTAAITFSTTPATLVSNMQSAIDALPNVSGGDLVVSGAAVTAINIVSSANVYWHFLVEADALTGNTTDDPNVVQVLNQQGATTVVISTEITKFNYDESIQTVDMRAINEVEAKNKPVGSEMSFSMMIFDAVQDWFLSMHEGQNGLITVYEHGKVVGRPYYAFNALISGFSKDYPDHEKLQVDISGERVGAMVVPFESIYR